MKNHSWYAESIEHLEDVVGLMAIPDSFMFSKCECNMWSAFEDGEVLRFVREQMPDYHKADLMSIKLTPINVSGIMNAFFYSKATHVILSTGTWVDKKGMMKTFGIDENSVEFISIPTTFKCSRRPVYILRGSKYMDFSRKTENGEGYEYKTHNGTLSFTDQLGDIVEKVRLYYKAITPKHLNINIIVHSFSFDIARRIAEYCPYVDGSWLIQIGKNDRQIRNKRTGHITNFIYKDELLQHLFRHPNEGITMVSASLNEGVDLKYDIARAQIILKRPIPSLGDPYVMSKYRGNPAFNIPKDPNYLDRAVYTDMMQMYGRVMRSEDDWGVRSEEHTSEHQSR
jgi:Rad3-related DNA helicase